jgi:Na+-driven multidrug efflux pump
MLSLLIDSPPVVRTGLWPMVLAGLAQPGFAVAIVMGSALKGAGETIWPMLSTIVGMFAIRVPAMLIALHLFVAMGHRELGLVAVWVGILVDLNARGLFNLAVFARGRWRHKRV